MQNTKSFATAEVNALSVAEAAKVYIHHGLKVVPDRPRSKQPAVVNWPNSRTSATPRRTVGGRAE
jgi:hypothetical protein